jgi:serine/threonine-protein kinase
VSDELTVAEPSRRRRVELAAGVRIGSYTLTGRMIGSGGYAHVYEATHPTLELRVAIKIQDAGGDELIRARGLQEAMVLARIQHRNVVQIFDAGELEDGRQYLAMELLTGKTLRDLLNEGTRPRAQTLAVLRGIASALDAVHARGLVHRDLKPSNIFMCRDDDGEVYPKLIDFGIAKDLSLSGDRELTTSGSFIGTPAYMSPEQCLGKRTIDARSDIYALGVVAYQMLAGHPPFDGVVLEVAHAHAHAPVPSIRGERSDLPEALDAAFARILAKAPEARPAAASEAIELIAEALADRVPPASPASSPTRARRAPVLAVAGGLALGLAGIAAWTWAHRGSEAPAPTPPPRTSAPVRAVLEPPPDVEIDGPAVAPPIADAAVATPAVHEPKRRPARPKPPHHNIDDVESLPTP